jgi:hypothetical protein
MGLWDGLSAGKPIPPLVIRGAIGRDGFSQELNPSYAIMEMRIINGQLESDQDGLRGIGWLQQENQS